MKNLQIPLYLELVRFYIRYFPIDKGKRRILNLFLSKIDNLPRNLIVSSRNGRKFRVNLNDYVQNVIFYGELREV